VPPWQKRNGGLSRRFSASARVTVQGSGSEGTKRQAIRLLAGLIGGISLDAGSMLDRLHGSKTLRGRMLFVFLGRGEGDPSAHLYLGSKTARHATVLRGKE
jgi:hypothetical protein